MESYQITLGGDAGAEAKIGSRAGPGFGADEIVPAIERLVLGYLELRSNPYETFLQSYQRLGAAPFRAMIYPAQKKAA
jgi:sulfite reductase (NADPH) hemoprotein beta-component